MKDEKIVSVLSNGVHIPAKLCQMTFEAFNGVYESMLGNGLGLEEAYHVVEECHEMIFGNRRYSSYDSFRKVRSRKIKK